VQVSQILVVIHSARNLSQRCQSVAVGGCTDEAAMNQLFTCDAMMWSDHITPISVQTTV